MGKLLIFLDMEETIGPSNELSEYTFTVPDFKFDDDADNPMYEAQFLVIKESEDN
jgi:hypothetical protein